MLENLNSLGFEAGLTEDEKCVCLRSRSAGLTVSGCAHAVFVCQLFSLLRKKLTLVSENGSCSKTHICVGILGGGNMGKQLAMVLLRVSSLEPHDINISTKRPETLEEITKMGVECYYDNIRLAKWTDVLFLCVLPSHISQVCTDLRSHLPSRCLVYSFPSAVPLNRLAVLLEHSFIIKSRYTFVSCGDVNKTWNFHSEVTAALQDKEVLAALVPLSMSGGLSLDQSWVSAVLYSLLNMCTAEKLASQKALQLLNEMFKTSITASNTFTVQSFVNSSCASALINSDDPFPWINLVDAQTKMTPLSDLVSGNKSLQDCIAFTFHNSFSNLLGPKDA
ncbi:putative NADP-dependent oxidoreductase domain-containing protein 1 [Triplophysa rosa]|uniref:NADP-dependent oxidoreductase domain-containing protein 1 n=1 Tax=Triplophysa rosa TaxID=992332 RepID=A0A9W7TWD5_TRIRA|nr:putative NADP-dependent oxidoreductase domain-containing protein 1 [Triplophysa rosa]